MLDVPGPADPAPGWLVTATLNPWRYALAEFAEPEDETAQPDVVPGAAAAYRDRPADFARHCIRWPGGTRLEDYQAELLEALAAEHRLVTRGPHGLGKTTVEALAILWFAITREATGRDWKVPTTAGVGRQLSVYLWPEVHKWVRRVRWELLGLTPWAEGRELLDMGIKLRHGEAFAASVNNPGAIEGAHAQSILFVFTEAKLISGDVFDAAEGAFSGAGEDTADEAFALAQSTPGLPAGRFYDLCRRAKGTEDWTFRRVTKDQVIAAGRMSREWAEARRRQWGEGSSVYQNRVLGEFADDAADTVIPLSWVEAANERWMALTATSRAPAAEFAGIDIARGGTDRSVLVALAGSVVGRPVELPRGDGPTVAAGAYGHVGLGPYGPRVLVDSEGVGASVFDVMRRQANLGPRTAAFRAGTGTEWRDVSGELSFANLRSAAWWHLRELLDPALGADLALPPDDQLTGDLTTPKWRHTARGIVIEAKDDIRKRLGRSTDAGDALVMGAWGRVMRAQRVRPSVSSGPPGTATAPVMGDILNEPM